MFTIITITENGATNTKRITDIQAEIIAVLLGEASDKTNVAYPRTVANVACMFNPFGTYANGHASDDTDEQPEAIKS